MLVSEKLQSKKTFGLCTSCLVSVGFMSVAPVLSPESQPLPNVWEDPRLGKGTLATLLEQQPALRQRMHDQENPHVTRWLTKDATGVASVRAMALNPTLLELVAEWYCSVQPNPKALCLSVIRREVGGGSKNGALKCICGCV